MPAPGVKPLFKLPPVVPVRVTLPHESRYFVVPRGEILRDGWGSEAFANLDTKAADLNISVPSAVVNLYALWLHNKPLLPAEDVSKPCEDRPLKLYCHPSTFGPINLESLANGYQDGTSGMNIARQLFMAYFLGGKLGAPHFQDAVMNTIVKYFTPDAALPVELVRTAYVAPISTRCIGIKKWLVDYYIWSAEQVYSEDGCLVPRIVHATGHKGCIIQPLTGYPMEFGEDVTKVYKANGGRAVVHFDKVEMIWKGEVVKITQWERLRDSVGGSLRCRYHQHGPSEMCYNLIV